MRTRLSGTLLAGLVALTTPGAADVAVAEPAPSVAGSSFVVAAPPSRVLDTRNGVGAPTGALGERRTLTLDVGTTVPPTATAVVLNVTAVSPTSHTYVTAWPAGTPRPAVSSLNLRTAEIRANAVTVPVGPDRRVSLYNHNGDTHLVVDLAGHYGTGTGSWYNPVSPRRVLDTAALGQPLAGGGSRAIRLGGLVPPDATAVAVNVTAVRPNRTTYLSVFPEHDRPTTSSLNVMSGEITPNLVTVAVGADLGIAVSNHVGSVHVLVDLIGYYSPDHGAGFHPVTARRAYDSRTTGWLLPDTVRRVPLGEVLPPQAETALFNLTGLGYYYGTYLTAWQAGQPRPGTSTVNLRYQQTASNLTAVPLGADRGVDVFNHSDHTHVIVDVFGYFAPRRG